MKMNFIKKAPLVLIISAFSTIAFAQSKGSGSSNDFKLKIEPLLGFETVFRDYPTPHTVTHQIYGLRIVAGIERLSAEAEYTKGTDTKDNSTAPEKVKFDDEKVKLGIRSSYNFTQHFLLTARLGGQARQTTRETTSGGVVTTEKEPIKYSPYAGAFLGINFGTYFRVNAGTTVVFNDSKDMSKNEVQNTISVNIGIK